LIRDPLRLPDYLGHINEAITRILSYCKDMDEAGFLDNAMLQDAVIRNFEIIGEASRNIERVAPQFVENHPELPLAYAYEMRNVLAHGYYKVALALVWTTIERDLPKLQTQVAIAISSRSACALVKP
jgi:uncharacterized protein with HEPN domain